jgi:predicted O-methyltransferase YrrM
MLAEASDKISHDGALSLWTRTRQGIQRDGWPSFASNAATKPVRPVLAPLAGQRLRRRAGDITGIEQLLDLTFNFRAFGISIRPAQMRWEFRQLLQEVDQIQPRAMLEIGTANGGSLFALAQLCAPDAHIISVDLPHGQFGGGYPKWKLPLYESFTKPGQRLDLLRGDSHDASVVEHVRSLLGGRSLDLLFIDGDHSYDGVRRDFDSYQPLVRPGGLIAFHDISPARPEHAAIHAASAEQGGDVPLFWSEVKVDRDAQEFMDRDRGGTMGIGVIRA